jgi:NAD-dependent dihydropyrimidine dehydrogenase PreA subunit
MPYVITTLCTNDGSCVEVCPVSCIHTTSGASQFYIDPDVCIDCEQCEIVCPVDAIFKDIEMPAEHTTSIESTRSSAKTKRQSDGAVRHSVGHDSSRAGYAQRFGNAVTAVVVDRPRAGRVGRMDQAEPRTAELAFNKAYRRRLTCDRGARTASTPTLARRSSSRTMGTSCLSAVPDDYQRCPRRRHWCGGIEPSRPGRAVLSRHGRVGKSRT